MKRMYRRVLLFCATVVFLALAPLIIFYAMGYRRGPTSADPRPVGVVYIETVPRGAEVFVGGRSAGRTPQAVTDVLAGTATVSVQREGYQTWEKNVPVRPGLVTELRELRLFPAERSPSEIASGVELVELSPNRLLLAVLTERSEVRILDTEGQLVGAPVPVRVLPRQLQWAPHNNALLLHNADGTVGLITIGSETHSLRIVSALQKAKKIAWDQRIPSRVLVHTQHNELRIYNLENNTSLLVASGIKDFGADTSNIYAILSDASLGQFNLQGQPQKTMLLAEVNEPNALLVAPSGNVAVRGKNGAIAVLANNAPTILARESLAAAWSPSGQMLYIQTDSNSVHVVNVSDERSFLPLQQMQLISRLSRPIAHVQWFAGSQHLLMQVEDELLLTEVDTRDHAKSWQIDTTNLGNAQAAVGEDGSVVFYLKRHESAIQLFRLPLIIE